MPPRPPPQGSLARGCLPADPVGAVSTSDPLVPPLQRPRDSSRPPVCGCPRTGSGVRRCTPRAAAELFESPPSSGRHRTPVAFGAVFEGAVVAACCVARHEDLDGVCACMLHVAGWFAVLSCLCVYRCTTSDLAEYSIRTVRISCV